MKFGALQWTTCVYLCLLIALIAINSHASHSPDMNILDDLAQDEHSVVDKRSSIASSLYADLGTRQYPAWERSYNPEKPHHNKDHVIKRRWNTYSRLLRLYFKRKNPWLFMENKGYCYQSPCKKNKDCCTMNNICDKSAKVCIDCWYGYPCNSNADCCHRYPVCNKLLGERHGRCSRV